ncbi:hypothetical protein [Methylotuvimicrobium sp.]|uniref:hypothetical protein n=1 Tax=Methylotuvimicrobium sp. TaxID=2822413 RepID=UPI003D64AF88
MKLLYTVRRGKQQGSVLVPVKQKNGRFVVSKTRFQSDQIYVSSLEDVYAYLQRGYKVRMGNPDSKIAPSLVKLESIQVVM